MVNEIVDESRKRGVTHLTCQGSSWEGHSFPVDGNTMLNFGSCGYLGLETDPRLIEKSVEYTRRYGTQFGISRAFVTTQQNRILEEQLGRMFDDKNVLVYSSTSLAHNSVLPIMVSTEDAIVLDQQVHFSVQNAVQTMAGKGVPVKMIRHSNLAMLERTILEFRDKHEKIWYMIDGVYSMYGDIAPISALNDLMDKYPQLYLYADDAHGMGWCGNNGTGAIFNDVKHKDRLMHMTTMGKAFGCIGGVAVFPTESDYKKVQTFGGALSYSHPLPPPVVGAALASAELMLSDELPEIQAELQSKIDYCNELLEDSGLPIMSDGKTPIFFIGTGRPSVGYELNRRLLNDGFYINLAVYPAVPMKNTGLRFSINRHLSRENISAFVEALKFHYPRVLLSENTDVNKVRKAFKLPMLDKYTGIFDRIESERSEKKQFTVEVKRSIEQVDRDDWNSILKDEGNYSYETMCLLERAFSCNSEKWENWEFYYLTVREQGGGIVAATCLTKSVVKDDLFAPRAVSEELERVRRSNPNHLTSESLVMGSLFSQGEHLHYDEQHPRHLEAVRLIVEEALRIQEASNANGIVMRDFAEGHEPMCEMFHELGFIRVPMPNVNTIENVSRNPELDFISTLSRRSRRHVRNEVIKHYDSFDFEVKQSLTSQELDFLYEHYVNIAKQNVSINTFPYPKSVFEALVSSSEWEFPVLYLKQENVPGSTRGNILAIGCCYVGGKDYTPLLLGMDYSLNDELNVYKQFLFRIAENARARGMRKVFFGYTADTEKRKLGASSEPRFAFVHNTDDFSNELIAQISSQASSLLT